MSKRITLGALKTLDSKKYTTRKIIVGNFEVTIDEHFKNTKILQLIQEYLTQTQYATEHNIAMNKTESYLDVLVMKYFSDIEFTEKYENHIQITHYLLNQEDSNGESYWSLIMNSFDKEELIRFNKKIKEFTTKINENIDELKLELENELKKEKVKESEEMEGIDIGDINIDTNGDLNLKGTISTNNDAVVE